jgi:epoxyqueuosine reductase
MKVFDQYFLDELKKKLEVELLAAAPLNSSAPAKLREQADALLPGAQSVVVFAKEIFPEVVALLRAGKGVGEATPGDLFQTHTEYLSGRLTRAAFELGALLRKEGYAALPLPSSGSPSDQRFLAAVFSYKHAAQLAGLGSFGRHSLMITPQYGPRIYLTCLLTKASFEDSAPATKKDYCINCDACIRVCPAKALQAPPPEQSYAINKFACRMYRQSGLPCTVCMKACSEILG